MLWLQEYSTPGMNRADYKLFYCEQRSDEQYAPTLTASGDPNGFVPGYSPADIAPVKVGDQILVWGEGDLLTMMPDGNWKAVGE